MAIGKVPGIVGLLVELYNYFWPEIESLVVMSLNSSLYVRKLSSEQTRVIITLLPNEGKILIKKIENWRPSLLLNVDFKIVASYISTKLMQVLLSILIN